MNNTEFGNIMENIWSRFNIEVGTDENIEKFDPSNYPKDHPRKILTGVNKKVLGRMRDEADGKQIEKFESARIILHNNEWSLGR